MDDIKTIVAKNIAELRLLNNMTQLELAEKLNYSDKTISKWERAESSPDIAVLVEIADLFGVTLDYMVRSENIEKQVKENKQQQARYNHRVITYISEFCAWFVAIFAFILTSLIVQKMTFQWLYFVYALPIVLIIRLVFNSIWFNRRCNYCIISCLMWTMLICIALTAAVAGLPMWQLILLGVPGQVAILLWSCFRKKNPGT